MDNNSTIESEETVNLAATQESLSLAATHEVIPPETQPQEPETETVVVETAPAAPAPRSGLRRFWPKSLIGALENVGDAVDRKLGRLPDPSAGVTTPALVDSLKRQIDKLVRDEGRKGRVAPHLIKLKVEWGKHDNSPGGKLKALEHELLAAAIDHINDHRYRTLAPVKIEVESDIFAKTITVLPTFGEFEDELQQRDESRRRQEQGLPPAPIAAAPPSVARETTILARITRPGIESHEAKFVVIPGGPRVSVGRGADNPLRLGHSSVSKIHAALKMKKDGTLILADTGSTNGTFVNGRRLSYGEAHTIADGDVLGFGEVEVRLRR